MIGVLSAVQIPADSHLLVLADVGWEMLVGVVVGAIGGLIVIRLVNRWSRPLDPITALAAAGMIYGVGAVAHGSGFLAVFIAGLLIGDNATTRGDDVRTLSSQLASVAELVVFVALGLTVSLQLAQPAHRDRRRAALAAILILIARPLAVGAILWPVDLRRGEKVFVGWLGLRGAVPILLAAFAVDEHIQQAHTVYGIVFIVVTVSVLIQGSLIEWVARRVGVAIGPPSDHA